MFTLIFNQLLKMLFIMLLAYFCYKIGLITQEKRGKPDAV